MKAATAALQTLLASPTAQLVTADLYTFTLVTGQVLRWSSLDRDTIFGGNTFTKGDQAISRSALKQQTIKNGKDGNKLQIRVAALGTPLIALGLSLKQALVAGLFDGATVRVDRIFNPALLATGQASVDATSYGSIILFVGFVADVEIGALAATLSCSETLDLLSQQLPKWVYTAHCRWTTYDAGCTLNRANFTISSAALSGSTPTQIVVPGLTIPSTGIPHAGATMFDGWLDQGSLTWTSGKNLGLVRSITSFLGAGNQRNYATAILNDQPIAYYRLGETVGSGTVADSSGNGITGTVHGGVTLGVAGALTGDPNTAASFDGSTGYISMPIPKPTTFSGYGAGVSFEFWCKPNAVPFSGIFDTGNFTNYVPAGSGFGFSAVKWAHSQPICGFAINTGVWSHVVAVFRGGRYIDVYVNGNWAASSSAAGGDNYTWNASDALGRATDVATVFFNGSIDEYAVYNYPLSSDQVATHYLVGTTAPSVNAQGLITLFSALPFAPAAGDTFTAVAGDDHQQTTCTRKFNNLINFGGFPFLPSNETAF